MNFRFNLFSLFLGLSLFYQLLFALPLWAKVVEPDQETALKIEQTTTILRAIRHQDQGAWSHALSSWKKVIPSQRRGEAIFQNLILSNHPPQISSAQLRKLSEKNALFLLNYLFWQKKWGIGVELLNQLSITNSSHKILIQAVSFNLHSGLYQRANKLLLQIHPSSIQEELTLELMKVRLEFLTGDQETALKHATQIQNRYLYIRDSQIIPSGIGGDIEQNSRNWYRHLILFPQDMELLENIFRKDWREKDFQSLQSLLYEQVVLLQTKGSLSKLADFLNDDLQLLNKIKIAQEMGLLNPQFLEGKLELYRYQNDWKKFKRIAKLYASLYPELEDGKLYLSEALTSQKTPATKFNGNKKEF